MGFTQISNQNYIINLIIFSIPRVLKSNDLIEIDLWAFFGYKSSHKFFDLKSQMVSKLLGFIKVIRITTFLK